VVEPGVLIENYGADATRLALAFIGPYTDTYPWNENTIVAMWRLVRTMYLLKDKVKTLTEEEKNTAAYKRANVSYNKLTKAVTSMIEALKMNTAISEIMIFLNELKKYDYVDTHMWRGFIKVIAPFTPFVAEELWQTTNNYTMWEKNNSVHLQAWPTFDSKILEENELTIPVMINGKVRGQVNVVNTDTDVKVKEKVLADEKLVKYVTKDTILKFIYIQKKIASIQVKM